MNGDFSFQFFLSDGCEYDFIVGELYGGLCAGCCGLGVDGWEKDGIDGYALCL